MLNTASFESVKNFAKVLMTSRDNARDVYTMFVDNPEFQNEYNIKQLYKMLDVYVSRCKFDRNIKHQVELLTMFISKYRYLDNLLSRISFPDGATIIVTEQNGDISEFTTEDFGMEYISDKAEIKISYNGKHIMDAVVNVVEHPNLVEIFIDTYNTIRFFGIELEITFHSFEDLSLDTNQMIIEHLTEIGKLIYDDDVEQLREAIIQPDTDYSAIEDDEDIDVRMDNEFFTNPIYLSMATGSINCFRYLYANGFYEQPTETGDLCLLFGNNIEMFRIISTDGKLCNSKVIFKNIIKMFNADLFNFWIVNEKIENFPNVIAKSVSSFNYEALESMIKEFGTEIIDGCKTRGTFTKEAPTFEEFHFEVVQRYFPWLPIVMHRMNNIHIEYLVSNKTMFPRLVEMDNNDILESMVLSHCRIESIKNFISTSFKNGILSMEGIFKISDSILLYADDDRELNGGLLLKELIGNKRDWDPVKELFNIMASEHDVFRIDYSTVEYFIQMENFERVQSDYLDYFLHCFRVANTTCKETALYMKFIKLFKDNGIDASKLL